MANPKDRRESFLFIAWAASVIAMFGSLYFSEIRQYEPCELCWYQRIVMYPFVIIIRNCLHKKGLSDCLLFDDFISHW